MQKILKFSEEVTEALENKKPIVALESTIISHGLPYPENFETANMVENIIREHGATPATIALHQGLVNIGLDGETLKHFAQSQHIHKASRRDIAYMLSQNLSASTTVAATMYCAHLANIHFFVTGGIGGVHHMARESFDISADLIELSKTPMVVICAGAKSILDLSKTLEVLETQGVPVVGYQTQEFPAFYHQKSGLQLSMQVESPKQIAKLLHYQQSLALNNGLLVANPIPKDAEIPAEEINPVIAKARLEEESLQGKEITPLLLAKIAELSQGQSIKANVALIKNNAELGAKAATAYHQYFL